MIINPTILSNQILSETSKKLSQLQQVNDILSSDFFIVERSYPKQIQLEILREELSSNLEKLIVLLEDDYNESEYDTYQYLINETKHTLQNISNINSYRLDYNTLSTNLIKQISTDYNFGTMAYEEKWDYSKIWHTHDYSYVNFEQAPASNVSAIANIIITDSNNANILSLCMPNTKQIEYKIADIGEYRYIARTNRSQININSNDFDGWVYVDGSTYRKDDFPEAYEIFNPDHIPSDQFTIPCISNFIKLNGFSDTMRNDFSDVIYQNSIHEHSHPGIDSNQFKDYSGSTRVQVKLSVYYSGFGSTNVKALHTGYVDENGELKQLSVIINSNTLRSIPTKTIELGLDYESRPENQLIPMMVYIGKRSKK